MPTAEPCHVGQSPDHEGRSHGRHEARRGRLPGRVRERIRSPAADGSLTMSGPCPCPPSVLEPFLPEEKP